MKTLVNKLQLLKTIGVVGVKQSFEDEGAILQDVILMRRITELSGVYMSVKIGGCEALSDINNCVQMGSDGIVAPMVETEFALQKFIESVSNVKDTRFYINIESKTAYENLDNILNSPSSKLLTGIVVGRSDLTKSYGLSKTETDSKMILDVVYNIMSKSKEYGFTNLMGGNISTRSCEFIKTLYNDGLLDYIETRNVIVKLDSKNTQNLMEVVKSILEFEADWMEYKSNIYTQIGSSYKSRANLITNRIDNER